MSRQPPRPYRGLAKIIAKVCDDRGEAYPWDKPPLHVDLPDVPDDATPGQIMLAEAAAHRQFMESVESPPPPARGGGRHWQPPEPEPVLEPEKRKPRPLRDIVAEYEKKARANAAKELRENPRGREPDTGRGRGYGR